MDWNSLQAVTQGLTLKDLLHPKFVENLNKEFEGKKIEITNIRIKVSDEDISDAVEVDFVTLFTRDLEDLLLNQIVVDVTDHENLDKIKSAIEKNGGLIIMTVDTLVAQQENDYSKTLMIVDKSSHRVQNNVNLVKNDVSEEYDIISNLNSVIDFNKSLDNLAIILNKIPSFSHEFHCVMSVRRMSEFILTDDNFTLDYFEFLLTSVDQFINIIDFKLNNLSKIGSSSCKKEYKKLSREFLKSEKFFFTKVYKSSRSHDTEFFEDMIRLLAR